MTLPIIKGIKADVLLFFTVLFFIFFPPLIEGGTTYLPVTIIRLFTLLTIIVWFANAGEKRLTRSGLELYFLAFLVLAVIAFWLSPYKYLASQHLLNIIDYLIIFYIFLNFFAREKYNNVFLLLAIMAFFEASLGIAQAWIYGVQRPHGTFFNPDFFGSYLAMLIPVLLSFLADYFRKKFWIALPAGISITVVCYAILLTQSRGAFLAASIGGLAFMFLRFRRIGAAAVMAAAIVLFLLSPGLKERVFNAGGKDPYSYSRLGIWKNAVERVAERPFGEGLGAYRLGTQGRNFPAPDGPVIYSKIAESAHNGYLQVAVEMGVVALVALLSGMIALLSKIKRFKNKDSYTAALFAGLLAFLAHALVDSVFLEPALVITALALAAALTAWADEKGSELLSIMPTRAAKIIFGASAIVAAVFLVFPLAGWMYYNNAVENKGKEPLEHTIGKLEKAVFFAPGNASYHDTLAGCFFDRYAASRDAGYARLAGQEVDVAMREDPLEAMFPYHKSYLLEAMAGKESDPNRKRTLESEALDNSLKSVRLNPYNPFYSLNASNIAVSLGKLDMGAELLLRSLKYEPNFLPGRLALAGIFIESGRIKEGVDQLFIIKKVQKEFSSEILSEKKYQVNPQAVEELLQRVKKNA